MDLILKRFAQRGDGIYSTLTDLGAHELTVTLEHAYPSNGQWIPKIPSGRYRCVRGWHRLQGDDYNFQTFEITGVLGHTNLLFHTGNYNGDSSGCILVGDEIIKIPSWYIVRSVIAFERFLSIQKGIDTFELSVINI